MKSSEYWQNRFELIESASHRYAMKVYLEIESTFYKMQKELQDDINAWIVRIADNNKVSILEARKLLNNKELAEFKWDINEYIKYGMENAINQKWVKQLENASARFHISRLEALKIQTQNAMEKAFGNETDAVDEMARRIYSNDYLHTAFEIHKGLGVGWDVSAIDERKLSTLIVKPWAADGKNFSDRIWEQKGQMVNRLHDELVRICILGKAPDEAINHMMEFVKSNVKNARNRASALVQTEQAFFSSAAQKDCFNELDVEQFEVVAVLDSKTSQICRDMDGKVFNMKDFKPGITAPPFHVNCRSTTAPYFDDDFGEVGERVATSEDGKSYYVPADMTYREWEKTFVKNELQGNKKDGRINKNSLSKNGAADVHYIGKLNKDIYSHVMSDILTDEVIITDERIRHVKERHPGDFEQYCQYMHDIVSNPDYIIEANKPKSALLLKSFTSDNEKFKAVLRLVNSTDNPEFMNSIITFMRINESEWNRLIKNKTILYKHE